MKYVKTESAIYLTLGSETEIISRSDSRFNSLLELLEKEAPDSEIFWCLYGDIVNKAKDALTHLGERTI